MTIYNNSSSGNDGRSIPLIHSLSGSCANNKSRLFHCFSGEANYLQRPGIFNTSFKLMEDGSNGSGEQRFSGLKTYGHALDIIPTEKAPAWLNGLQGFTITPKFLGFGCGYTIQPTNAALSKANAVFSWRSQGYRITLENTDPEVGGNMSPTKQTNIASIYMQYSALTSGRLIRRIYAWPLMQPVAQSERGLLQCSSMYRASLMTRGGNQMLHLHSSYGQGVNLIKDMAGRHVATLSLQRCLPSGGPLAQVYFTLSCAPVDKLLLLDLAVQACERSWARPSAWIYTVLIVFLILICIVAACT